MRDRVAWLLFTPPGRRLLVTIYVVGACVSVVTYGFVRSPVYAAVQAVVLGVAPLWIRWCLRRA